MSRILLIILIQPLFVYASIMQDYSTRLNKQNYELFTKQGITSFKYHNCSLANPRSTAVYQYTRIKYTLLRKFTQKENAFLEHIRIAVNYLGDYKNEELNALRYVKDNILISKEYILKAYQNLDTFINQNPHLRNMNLLYKPVSVFKRKGRWYCKEEVDHGLAYTMKYDKYNSLLQVYKKYKNAFKRMLSKNSYTMLRLLSNDLNIPLKDVTTLKNSTDNLLAILINLNKLDMIKNYQNILLAHYKGNIFASMLKKGHNNEEIAKINFIKDMGLNLFIYSDSITNHAIEHNDNLYLAIKHHRYNDSSRKSTKITPLEILVTKMPDTVYLQDYLFYAIKFHNSRAIKYLIQSTPKDYYSKYKISHLILSSAKHNNTFAAEYLIKMFPYEEYIDIKDSETGFNALSFAKEERYSGRKLAILLEKHNFKSQFFGDVGRQFRHLGSDIKEIVSGIGYVLSIFSGGYKI